MLTKIYRKICIMLLLGICQIGLANAQTVGDMYKSASSGANGFSKT